MNVSELVHFETCNGIAAHYDYAPFGAVTRAISASTITDNTFTTDNPFRFSSEYHDDTLGLVYYNYRHYNPIDGRWCGRDPVVDYLDIIYCSLNLFGFVENSPMIFSDYRGLLCEDKCIKDSVEILSKIEFSESIRGVAPETTRKNRELLNKISKYTSIIVFLNYLPIGSLKMLSVATSDALFSYYQTPGFDDALGNLLDLIEHLEDDSGLILRVFATFEYKKCKKKCCLFYKTYYDWKVVETSKQKMIMCMLHYEDKSEEEYMLSLQKAIEKNLKEWMESIGE